MIALPETKPFECGLQAAALVLSRLGWQAQRGKIVNIKLMRRDLLMATITLEAPDELAQIDGGQLFL
ncbi:MAG: hypothetical protein WKF84_00380 [Pyrinomonadaceae bacterium]